MVDSVLPVSLYKDSGFEQFLHIDGLISESDLHILRRYQKENGKRLEDALVELQWFTQEELVKLLCRFLDIPFVSLAQLKVDVKVAQMVSEELAVRYNLIPFSLKGHVLEIAMSDPLNRRALNDVHLYTGYEIKPFLSSPEEIKDAIRHYLTLELSIARLATSELRETNENKEFNLYSLELEYSTQDAPTIRLVDSILGQAINLGVSDIHWEQTAEDFRVRFRLDGELQTVKRLPLQGARSIIARLKVMSRMDVSERRLPQDGRFTIDWDGRCIDLRVSSLPTVYGEKVVLRILDSFKSIRTLDELGMNKTTEESIRTLLNNPHGLILVAGPTGSGKTTTLYAMLREIATENRNIVTIEDPVEYRLAEINQVNVQAKIGLSFGRGLRSILRQDPDVIMIGEIRDEETARIAVTAALTGHLVLSTVHTNTAAEAISRLLDIGIEPYLLASSLTAVLSQRLVRKLCEQCREHYEVSKEEKEFFPSLRDREVLYKAKGCANCRGGYIGRLGIYELLQYDEDIKSLIFSRRSGAEIEQCAISKGMIPLVEDGLIKVTKGVTTVAEIIKVKVSSYI